MSGFSGGGGGGGAAGNVVVTVAAADTPAAKKALADFACDGIADEVEINAAIASVGPRGGKVSLLEGTFVTAAPILLHTSHVIVEGQGKGATEIQAAHAGGIMECNENDISDVGLRDLQLNPNGIASHAMYLQKREIWLAPNSHLIVQRVLFKGTLGADKSAVEVWWRDVVFEACEWVDLAYPALFTAFKSARVKVLDCSFAQSSTSNTVVWLAGEEHLMSGCTFFGPSMDEYQEAIRLYGTNHVVSSCLFQDWSGSPIVDGGAKGSMINGNIFNSCGPVEVYKSEAVITGNKFSDSQGEYALLMSAAGLVANNMIINAQGETAIKIHGSRVVVARNVVVNSAHHGIVVDGGADAVVTGNVLVGYNASNDEGYGGMFISAVSANVYGNTLRHSGHTVDYGLYIAGGTNHRVWGNDLLDGGPLNADVPINEGTIDAHGNRTD